MKPRTSITKRGASPAGVGSRARVSAKCREAIGYIVTLGCTQEQAAKLAGMHRAALNRALAKPHVKAALHAAQDQRIKDINAKRGLYKALAWERCADIALNSKDERVSLKAVELLASEGRQSGVQVNVQTNVQTGGGYEFVPPNARVVEIALDQASSDTDAETPAIAGDEDDL